MSYATLLLHVAYQCMELKMVKEKRAYNSQCNVARIPITCRTASVRCLPVHILSPYSLPHILPFTYALSSPRFLVSSCTTLRSTSFDIYCMVQC
jgi:hypothetical protein